MCNKISYTELRPPFNTKEYNFLSSIDNIIYLTLGGSRVYGTNTDKSDWDLRGVFVESLPSLFTLQQDKEEYADSNTDTCLYSLKKFIKLLANCNPNIIEILGTRKKDIIYINSIGKLLRDNYHLFLSKRAYYAFNGYATTQLRRLQNALARDYYSQSDKELHILKSIQNDLLGDQLVNMYDLDKQQGNKNNSLFNLALNIKETNNDLDCEIFIDGTLTHVPLREYIVLNNRLANTLKNYAILNHRNRKKDDEHLNKHAMHLIRLYYMGIDILGKQEINVYREREHDLLMSIRNGELSFDKIFALQKKLEAQLEKACAECKLPERADMSKINSLLMDIYSNIYVKN